MANLTKEQMQEIQEYINTLPETERESKLKEIMSQFEQPQQCPFCLMSENKIPTTRVYEDANFMAVLEINPSNPGHTLLFPKKHIQTFSALIESEVESLSKVIKKLESALMILYKSCNVVISDGPFSGNRFEHLTINLIPRQQKDNVVINWKGNKAVENNLKKVQQDIIQAIPIEKKEIQPEPPKDLTGKFRKKYLP